MRESVPMAPSLEVEEVMPRISSSPLSLGVQRGMAALRSQLSAGVMLWTLAGTIGILYYRVEAVTRGLDALGDVKAAWGFGFAAASLAISGGMLPTFFMWLQKMKEGTNESAVREASLAAATTAMFSAYGCWIDAFYLGQAAVFGEGTDVGTVATKVAVDQIIFTPFLHVPMIQLSLLYINCSLNCRAFVGVLRDRDMFSRHGLLADWWLPALLPTWMIWCPTVCVVYSLPPNLQVVIFAIVMVFWAMIQIVVGDAASSESPTPGTADDGSDVLGGVGSGGKSKKEGGENKDAIAIKACTADADADADAVSAV